MNPGTACECKAFAVGCNGKALDVFDAQIGNEMRRVFVEPLLPKCSFFILIQDKIYCAAVSLPRQNENERFVVAVIHSLYHLLIGDPHNSDLEELVSEEIGNHLAVRRNL